MADDATLTTVETHGVNAATEQLEAVRFGASIFGATLIHPTIVAPVTINMWKPLEPAPHDARIRDTWQRPVTSSRR